MSRVNRAGGQTPPIVCPSCQARLWVVSKSYLDVEAFTGMTIGPKIATRYDLICTNGHGLGGDYSYSPTPEAIAEAVEAAKACADLPLMEVPELG